MSIGGYRYAQPTRQQLVERAKLQLEQMENFNRRQRELANEEQLGANGGSGGNNDHG